MFNSYTIGIVRKVDSRAPREIKLRYLEQFREEFSIELYKEIMKSRHPVTVEIDEEINYNYSTDYIYGNVDEIRIQARLTAVERRNATIANQIPLEIIYKCKPSFLDKIKKWIKEIYDGCFCL